MNVHGFVYLFLLLTEIQADLTVASLQHAGWFQRPRNFIYLSSGEQGTI